MYIKKLFKPKVSIGLITFQRTEFLKQAIISLQSQTFRDFEVIISNDDPLNPITKKKLNIKNDRRFIIFNQKTNIGEIQNLNFVLKRSRGKYFSWLADDEVLYPQFLEKCIQALSKNCKHRVSGVYPFYESGEFQQKKLQKTKNCLRVTLLDVESMGIWYSKNPTKIIGIYGLLLRKNLIQIGGFRRLGTGFGPYSDNIIPLKLSTLGKILILHEKLYFYRTHPAALSVASTDIQSYWTAEIDFLKEIQELYEHLNVKVMRSIQKNIIKLFLNNSCSVLARGRKLVWSTKKKWLKHCLANYPRPNPKILNFLSMLRQALFVFSSRQ